MNAPLLASLLLTIGLAACGAGSEPVDLLIRGGTVIDGTGAPGQIADVGVRDGKVVMVGSGRGVRAAETIDATGLVVAPGFIDVHNHSDRGIGEPEHRLNEGFIRQGVTLIVGGPDGGWAPAEIAKLKAAYEANGVGTNYAFYVGHNGIRRAAMGESQQRPPTAQELDAMRAMVREGMEMGAIGLSTGLMYEPGMFSTTDEVVELAREVKPFGGIFDSHVRDPVKRLIESDAEVIEIGERAGVPANIAHEKSVALENEGKIREVIAMVNTARARGVTVTSDQYPYDGAATSSVQAIVVLPKDLRGRDNFDLKAALRNPAMRARLKQTSENGVDGGFAWIKATGYSSMRITSSRDYPDLIGKYLSELAKERGLSGFDLVSDLILRAEHPVGITLGAIKEHEVRELMTQPWNMIASDGAVIAPGSNRGHPRSTGTFPRVLGHYVREEGVLSLEDAIMKMTSLPAVYAGFTDRGRLAPEMVADIAIFDPKTIIDRSTWDEPGLYSEGVVHVLVNGVFVLKDGKMTGEAPGVFVPRSKPATTQTANR